MKKSLMVSALACPPALLLAWATTRPAPAGAAQDPALPPASMRAKARAATDAKPSREASAWTTAVEPKPISKEVKKGLDWLVEHQLPSGGWGQGEESVHMRGGAQNGEARKDAADVADTCIAVLALIRSGSTPKDGPYKDAIVKAVKFVRSEVDASDEKSLSVSNVQGTRVQQKLGPNIDTFLASMLLAEVKGKMPDAKSEGATDLAMEKVLGKIQRHQKADGSFEGAGWAPVLAQAMCGKGINRAKQAGAKVSEMSLARADLGAVTSFNGAAAAPAAPSAVGGGGLGGKPAAAASARDASASPRGVYAFSGGAGRGDAGVELYDRAASLGVLQDSVNTGQGRNKELKAQAANRKDPAKSDEATKKLAEIEQVEKVNSEAKAAVVSRLEDKQFVSGFGSNGGEEFLSYMNIAESLVVSGGDEWKTWDAKMTANLDRIQDGDGSWSGHHCITGRTFCTSTALLVLMADRTPVPVKGRKAEEKGKAEEKAASK